MQDDFDDGMELPDDELAGDSATDDGDLGLDGIDAEPEPVEEAQSRPSGGVRAKASGPAPARKAGGSAPAKKAPAKKAVVAKKAAPKKAAPKKKAAAKKSAAPKKKRGGQDQEQEGREEEREEAGEEESRGEEEVIATRRLDVGRWSTDDDNDQRLFR